MIIDSSNISNETASVSTVSSGPEIWSVEHLVLTSGILGLIILGIIIGNAFVIAAIVLEKNLHCVANYLILSLAVADFMVASIVMPISAVNEVTKHWFLGSEVCDIWISMDVLCCTASILSLVAIAVDRYWAVIYVDYTRKRTAKRILSMIALVWLVALAISTPGVFIFKDENNPEVSGKCIISQDHVYTIFSTVCAFYLPTITLLIIYGKIFTVARQRILRKRFSQKRRNFEVKQSFVLNRRSIGEPEVTFLRVRRDENLDSRLDFRGSVDSAVLDSGTDHYRTVEQFYFTHTDLHSTTKSEFMKAKKEKEKIKRKRERKVAITLTIITGAYIVCWLPFFIIALLAPFIRTSVHIPMLLESVTLWLGYCNSLLNPIIYTVFNPEFRTAFKDLLSGKCLRRYRRDSRSTLDSLWV